MNWFTHTNTVVILPGTVLEFGGVASETGPATEERGREDELLFPECSNFVEK